MRWAAVILTGGTGSRLGGADKASLRLGGHSFLELARAAVGGAAEVAVVGPEVGGGPLAGLAAGVASFGSDHDLVVVLAVDMPQVTEQTVARLLAAAEGADSAWLTDHEGRRQLAGALRPALVPTPEEAVGAPMRSLMTAGDSRDVPAVADEAQDVDTWADLRHLDWAP